MFEEQGTSALQHAFIAHPSILVHSDRIGQYGGNSNCCLGTGP